MRKNYFSLKVVISGWGGIIWVWKKKQGVDKMAVSLKATPIFKGEAAKKLIYDFDNPKDNSAIFKKCSDYAKSIKIIEK